jgi:hypothetical protein
LTLSIEDRKAAFLERCNEWLCDGYSCDVRYLAIANGGAYALFDAVVLLNPLPHSVDNSLIVRAGSLAAGQQQVADVPKSQLMAMVEEALAGVVVNGSHEMVLSADGAYQLHIAPMSGETWFHPLTCRVIGAAPNTAAIDRPALDTSLRASEPPFDGAEDLRNWLGLRLPASESLSSIAITVSPPVDLLIDRSGFIGDTLRLTLTSHRNADRSLVGLAIRAVPGGGLISRFQVADKITWSETSSGLFEGTVEIALPGESAALSMLLVGSETVRRHWFLHATNAPNYRIAAVKHFDVDLRMIRQGLFDSPDSRRFEAAVAALLFVLGFSAAVQLETDAPDIVVATPAGRIVLVECATRIADIGAKTGKLVDRRGALQKALRVGNKALDVSAALVCRLPRDQIAARSGDVSAMGVLLATAEDLNEALIRAEVSADADQILTEALQRLMARSADSP